MTHTVVDSEISSIGSRKSSAETESGSISADFAMAMEELRGRGIYSHHVNGDSTGGTWKWREEREGLLAEILECRRRLQVPTMYCYKVVDLKGGSWVKSFSWEVYTCSSKHFDDPLCYNICRAHTLQFLHI